MIVGDDVALVIDEEAGPLARRAAALAFIETAKPVTKTREEAFDIRRDVAQAWSTNLASRPDRNDRGADLLHEVSKAQLLQDRWVGTAKAFQLNALLQSKSRRSGHGAQGSNQGSKANNRLGS